MLSRLAEFERDLMRARTTEGRERAKANGVKMGRPPKLTVHQRQDALKALADGTVSQADLARRFNVSQRTSFQAWPMSDNIGKQPEEWRNFSTTAPIAAFRVKRGELTASL